MTNKENNFAKDINVPSKKQIMIDGVNITGCTWCDFEPNVEPYCRINDGEDLGCEDNPNCYFKQLARKTQECGQKEKEINELHLIIDRLLEASGYDKNISTAEDFEDVYTDIDYKLGVIDDLKQECEELKSESFTREELISLQEKDIDRYRKALEEIEKEIRDFQCDNCEDYHCETCDMKDILNIINKAKGMYNENT